MKTRSRVGTKGGATAIAVAVTAEECRFHGIRWLAKFSDRLRAGLTSDCPIGARPISQAVALVRNARLLSGVLVIACITGVGQRSVAQSAPASSKPQHVTVRHHQVAEE